VLSLVQYETFRREIRFASLNADNLSKNIFFRSIESKQSQVKELHFIISMVTLHGIVWLRGFCMEEDVNGCRSWLFDFSCPYIPTTLAINSTSLLSRQRSVYMNHTTLCEVKIESLYVMYGTFGLQTVQVCYRNLPDRSNNTQWKLYVNSRPVASPWTQWVELLPFRAQISSYVYVRI
jgi:hypothetical protein